MSSFRRSCGPSGITTMKSTMLVNWTEARISSSNASLRLWFTEGSEELTGDTTAGSSGDVCGVASETSARFLLTGRLFVQEHYRRQGNLPAMSRPKFFFKRDAMPQPSHRASPRPHAMGEVRK